ncbi:DUF3566 domain-containing protein [Streptomyces griseiscabiei]|uniref:DUF3566 domain-containing protein n=1 Tax=Streptomyces griseiscabiei TaxID=2993540 RepID=A0ABU4LAU4_9ACTN|nr:DUF3566 domain-containing protein [Streptomyces griseiscabiei]MDX2912723.1 DUF3566 domain-containing protein [Streptomyces griseiscabiei]
MSGATGAGSSGPSAGTSTESEADGGGRGSAARAADTHTTQLKAIKPGAADPAASSSEKPGPQGGTVTDTRGPQAQKPAVGGSAAAPGGPGRQAPAQPQPSAQGAPQGSPQAGGSALPGERQPQQATPYHPPQAYPSAPEPSSRKPRTGARTAPRTRKARLRVAKADPWSVMKVSFLLSIALGICTVVAAAVLWMVMNAMGVFSTVGATISEATGSNESNGFDLQAFLSLPNVLIFTSVIAVIDVVLATALATLGAFIYNLSAGFVGGIELTLAEDE